MTLVIDVICCGLLRRKKNCHGMEEPHCSTKAFPIYRGLMHNSKMLVLNTFQEGVPYRKYADISWDKVTWTLPVERSAVRNIP